MSKKITSLNQIIKILVIIILVQVALLPLVTLLMVTGGSNMEITTHNDPVITIEKEKD